MNRKILSVALAIVMICTTAFALSGCSSKSEYPVTVGSVTINSQPEKVVILSKNLADIISCIGYDVNMTGRSDEVTQSGLQVVPTVGTAQTPNSASIDEVGADVVFADSTLTEVAKEEIESLGVPVVVIDDAQTPKQVKSIYKKIGRILGGNVTGQSKATTAVNDLLSTMKDVKEAVAGDTVVKTICYLYIDNGVLKTMSNGTWGATMLDYTGAVNAFKNTDGNVVDTETLLRSNPDCIFCADEDVITYLKTSSVYSELDALTDNTYVVAYDDINMQGYTALDVLENMIKCIYPDQFSQ
jgi:iron complex transport system substrate-binding protein